jgi:hypothetical protein
MKQVLNKFVTTEGVLGGCVVHPEDGVFESNMPPNFSEEILRKIGHNLNGLTDLARSDFSDPDELFFIFENAALRMQDFNEGYQFIALFSPKMDRNILKKATDTFINEFEQAIAHPPKLSVVTPLDSGQGRQTDAQSADALSPEGLMNSGTLVGPVQGGRSHGQNSFL